MTCQAFPFKRKLFYRVPTHKFDYFLVTPMVICDNAPAGNMRCGFQPRSCPGKLEKLTRKKTIAV